jgi:hypothetical protein
VSPVEQNRESHAADDDVQPHLKTQRASNGNDTAKGAGTPDSKAEEARDDEEEKGQDGDLVIDSGDEGTDGDASDGVHAPCGSNHASDLKGQSIET